MPCAPLAARGTAGGRVAAHPGCDLLARHRRSTRTSPRMEAAM